MFTGLVQTTGTIIAATPSAPSAGLLLRVQPDAPWPEARDLREGDSISVSGVCLTLISSPSTPSSPSLPPTLAFNVHTETIAKTSLGLLLAPALPNSPSSSNHHLPRVNLETSATLATPLGGHLVQGHVEGLARVTRITTSPDWRVTFAPPKDLLPCIVPKGSICLDGVSLTVASVDLSDSTFDVALIPTTLNKTTLASLAVGSAVNLETDIHARTILNILRNFAHTLSAPPARDPSSLPS
jgi:riboflavin synthase